MSYLITVKQNGNTYDISSRYDPILISHIKNVPGRKWVPEEKIWTIPADKLGFFLAQLKGTTYESYVKIISDEQINQNATLDVTAVIPDVDISKIKYYVKNGSKPYQHQLDFMKYALYRQMKGNMNGFIIADDQGCITGDAKIYVSIHNQFQIILLADLYQLWINNPEWKENPDMCKVRCWRDDAFGLNSVRDVIYSGEQEVYELVLTNKYHVKATPDHEILTPTGYTPLSELSVNDEVIVSSNNLLDNHKQIQKVLHVNKIGVAPTYDIKMDDPYHNFLANMIVVHNCGKSLEASNLTIYNQKQNGFQHCLIICCINSSKYNWVRDIEEHTSGEYVPYIIGSRKKKNRESYNVAGGKEKLEDLTLLKQFGDSKGKDLPFFIILNIEAIRYRVGKKYLITDRLIELINEKYINAIIIDEVHKNVSPTSQQGKQLLRMKKTITESPMWLPMSGTPITKKPTDLFMPLRLVNGHEYNSFYLWAKEYCLYGGYGGYEIVGYKNVPRLKSQLQNNMIRRMKDDVLDLPPKIRYTEYVDNTPYQNRLYERIALGLIEQGETIVKTLNPLSKFLRLRQVNGNPELVEPDCDVSGNDYIKKNAKLQRLLELLEEIHERHEKVIIFSNWVESLRTLYKFVSTRYKTCCFTGTMKESDRQQHKQVFLNNPNYTVMLGTFGALGTTHTLTVARNEIMYDEPWNPADKVQAEDRIYRIGTHQSVNIYTLITRNTVDDRVHDVLYTKQGISEFIVDNKLDIMNNPKLFNLLLSDTLKNSRGDYTDENYK